MSTDSDSQYFILDSQELCATNECATGCTVNALKRLPCIFSFASVEHLKASLQLSVVCGILFGMFAILLWWIDFIITGYCYGKLRGIPKEIQQVQLVVRNVKVFMIVFWPLLTIAPVCSWSMIRQSNILFWCTIAGLVDAVDRLYLYTFGHYDTHWKSYVGNVIFLVIAFIVFYKFANHRQQESANSDKTMMVTFKISIQLILGAAVFLPYNYVFLQVYLNSTSFIRIILSCSLIAVFYIPKMIMHSVITNLHGIYKPKESIVFAVGFLVISTMVTRLTQAKIENLAYFTIISLVHGVFNVVDKVTTNLRSKLLKIVCRRRQENANENDDYVTHYIAHQSLISIITETSSVILSNAAAYLLVYYYQKGGTSYEGSILFKKMFIRSAIAVCIEWAFNIVALKVQCSLRIPVLDIWKKEWMFILVIHLVQVIFLIVYFADYVDGMLVGDIFHNSTFSQVPVKPCILRVKHPTL